MRYWTGKVVEMRLEAGGLAAQIECPAQAVPPAGQYLVAYAPASGEPLAAPLWQAEAAAQGFLAAAPAPRSWTPGLHLELHGPLGNGFLLPAQARRVALAAFGLSPGRLLPLVRQALQQGAAVAVFSQAPLAGIPASVEISPLDDLPNALSWADYLAADLPRPALPGLREALGLQENGRLPFPAQALMWTEMPCGGLASCGACALLVRGRWKLACEDGPVFNLQDLL